MFGGSKAVRALLPRERDDALALCARDPAAGVYVAARLQETDLDRSRGVMLAYVPDGEVEAICWASANFVPVHCDEAAATAFAGKLRRQQGQCSSIFGPSEAVGWMWDSLESSWRQPLEVRVPQPLLAIEPDAPLLVGTDPRVRPARMEDLDVLVPAAAAMFTEEIGYPPFRDPRGRQHYRNTVIGLIGRGRSFVIEEGGRIVFKADIGSVGVGACQIQGVWIDPDHRGHGLAAGAMASVVHLARQIAPLVTLYVNEYNRPALATYRRVGFSQVGTFATILF